MSERVLIVVPAYNEAVSIAEVVHHTSTCCPAWDILVINDCSTDDTGKRAAAAGATVIDLCCNLGIGGAVQTGLCYAHRAGYNIAVQVDGDGQHDARGISLLLKELENSAADVVIGSRFISTGSVHTNFRSTLSRRVGIRIISSVTALVAGYGIRDVTSGFRAYGRRAIELIAHEYPSDYPEPESLVMFHKAGFKVREIAVPMHPRHGGVSSITGGMAGYYMAKVLLALVVRALRSRPNFAL